MNDRSCLVDITFHRVSGTRYRVNRATIKGFSLIGDGKGNNMSAVGITKECSSKGMALSIGKKRST